MAATLSTIASSVVSSAPASAPLSSAPISPIETVATTPPASILPVDITASVSQTPAPGWARLADPEFYFNTQPYDAGSFLWGRPLAAFFTILLIIGFAILVRALLPRLKHRAAYRSTAYWLISFGIMGVTLLFFRWQHAPVLSMRLWLLILLVGFAVWIIGRLWGIVRGKKSAE